MRSSRHRAWTHSCLQGKGHLAVAQEINKSQKGLRPFIIQIDINETTKWQSQKEEITCQLQLKILHLCLIALLTNWIDSICLPQCLQYISIIFIVNTTNHPPHLLLALRTLIDQHYNHLFIFHNPFIQPMTVSYQRANNRVTIKESQDNRLNRIIIIIVNFNYLEQDHNNNPNNE